MRLVAKGKTFEEPGMAFLTKQRVEGKLRATLEKTEYHLLLANQCLGRKPIIETTAPVILKPCTRSRPTEFMRRPLGYGPTHKAIIQEKFGAGFISAIDFDVSVTRVEHPKGDPVKVEMSGKILGYNGW